MAVNQVTTVSLKALMMDLKWIATHIRDMTRLASIADDKFLGHLVDIDARIAHHIGIAEKHFTTDHHDAAWAWIKED